MISVALSSRLDCAAKLILTVEQKRICLHEALYVDESTVARDNATHETRKENVFGAFSQWARVREQDIKVYWRQKSAFILTQFSLRFFFGVENVVDFHFLSSE